MNIIFFVVIYFKLDHKRLHFCFSSSYQAGYPAFNSVSRGGMPAFAVPSFLPLLSLLFVYLF